MPNASSAARRPRTVKKLDFDAQVFLDEAGVARRVVELRAKAAAFVQGDPAKTVMYIQQGSVKLSVVNGSGKEAVVAVLGPGDFFGERWSRRPDLANRHSHRDYADDCTRD